ncbi:MAG: septum formation family protein [Egibacteraceae bacterium]
MSDPDESVTGGSEDTTQPTASVPPPPLPPPPPGSGSEVATLLHQTLEVQQRQVEVQQRQVELQQQTVERQQQTVELQQRQVELQTPPVEPPKAPPRVANPAAVAALVVGIVAIPVALLFVTAPLGALLAIIALVLGGIGIWQARSAHASGISLAIGGMVTGLIGLVAASVWLAIRIGWSSVAEERAIRSSQQIEAEAQRIQQQAGRIISVNDLSVGDCYDDLLGGNVQSVPLIDCNRPHRNEVFSKLRIDLGPDVAYPGVTELRRTVGDRCKGQSFTAFVGTHYYSGSPLLVDTIFPSPTTWAKGDRDVICVVSDPAGPMTSTMRDSGRKPTTSRVSPLFPSPIPVHPLTPLPSPSPLAPPT